MSITATEFNQAIDRLAALLAPLVPLVPGALAAGGAIIGKVGIDQTTPGTTNAVQPIASTTGGATPYHLLSAASANPTLVKGSAGQVYGVQLVNRSLTANAYVKFYDKASAPTVGTDTPKKTICLPAAASAILPTVVACAFPMPVAFSLGIALAITGGTGLDADTTAVAANDVTCDLDYK